MIMLEFHRAICTSKHIHHVFPLLWVKSYLRSIWFSPEIDDNLEYVDRSDGIVAFYLKYRNEKEGVHIDMMTDVLPLEDFC